MHKLSPPHSLSSKWYILFLAGCLLLPSFLDAQLPLPQENPQAWILAFVDVETTGLIPGYHEMIDIGVVLSTLDGNEIDRLFLRIRPQHAERASAEAIAINAFDPERWQRLGALPPRTAVDSLVTFHQQHASGRKILMVAFNSQFDAAFVDHLFRSAARSWREIFYYYVLDLPSMAWAHGVRLLQGNKLCDYFGIPDEPHIPREHTSMTGADLNYRLYREIISRSKTGHPE